MSSRDLAECGNPEGDGCVVHYKGGREIWCQHADQDTIKEEPLGANDEGLPEDTIACWVYCRRLKRRVPAAV